MQHIGDLQPLERPYARRTAAPAARYKASRSRWRFAIGSLEIGFDRASEHIQTESGQTAPLRPTQKLMILVGMLSISLLVIALAGWLWSARGPIWGGETVSAAIIDQDPVQPEDKGATAVLPAAASSPSERPAERPAAFLSAVIERRAPAPAAAPASRAAVPIARGEAIAPKAAENPLRLPAAPDEAIVASGNYLLIPSVERAVSLAMESGDAQSWIAGPYHGVVVVSEAQPRDDKSCRDGTILLRDGTPKGRTQSFERCL